MINAIVRNVLAIAVVAASLPLALRAVRFGFGYSAALVIPTCCLAIWLSITSKDRTARIGWFVFASVNAFLLPFVPWCGGLCHSLLHWADDIAREWGSTVYNLVEMGGLLLQFTLPWFAGMLLGRWAARTARRALVSLDGSEPHPQARSFTLRGMLLVMVVCCGLTAWLAGTVRKWQFEEQANQSLFLDQFQQTFSSGRVALLDEPRILGGVENIQSHFKQYRVSAPIEKDGEEKWAAWTYLTEADSSYIHKFEYAEAADEDSLPPKTFPKHLDDLVYVWSLTDGQPKIKTTAELVKASKSVRRGATVELAVKTDWGKQCELEISPFFATKAVPQTKTASQSGIVSWELPLDPKFRGSKVQYKIICRTNAIYHGNSVSGEILVGDSDEKAEKSTSAGE